MKRLLCALALALAGSASVTAHPTETSFVIVTVTSPQTVTINITTDAQSLRLTLEAFGGQSATFANVLLEHVQLLADARPVALTAAPFSIPDGNDQRARVTVTAVLPAGTRTLSFQSSLFLKSYPVLIRGGDPSAPTDADAYEWLNGVERSREHSLEALKAHRGAATRVVRTVGLGFTHILPGGLDHVLFVLGLFLLAGGTRALLLQITAFTVAHSVTLALASLGFISAPAAIVEPLIALSIAYVAIENLCTTSLSRWRLGVVFGFGLLHGLGFAGALSDLGVSAADLPATLLGFNIGVELGQIVVVAIAMALVRALPIPADRRRAWISVPASLAIAAMGAFWAWERIG